MTQERYVKIKGVKTKFDDVKVGDVFQLFEPDGTPWSKLEDREFLKCLSKNEYGDLEVDYVESEITAI